MTLRKGPKKNPGQTGLEKEIFPSKRSIYHYGHTSRTIRARSPAPSSPLFLFGKHFCLLRGPLKSSRARFLSAFEVTPATEMGQLRQDFVLQSEAENEIYAGFLVSFSNQKPGMKFTPALFGVPFS